MPSADSSKTGRGSTGHSPSFSTWHNLRETIESIVIAFILAFLFRTFEAEAFVIPTGSMAPTLQGRHKDAECPLCGYRYRTNASSEVDEESGATKSDAVVIGAICPMCRYIRNVDPVDDKASKEKSYSGDRILVSKLAYQMQEPQRYDVIVFHFPGGAKTNYIKRLIGLPNEAIQISGGDVYVMEPEDSQFRISHKPAYKVWRMAQDVHDTDYQPAELSELGWPVRWRPWPQDGQPQGQGWTSESVVGDDRRDLRQTFSIAGQQPGEHWIRYQHFVPNEEDWIRLRRGPLDFNEILAVPPLLISDFYAYNAGIPRNANGPSAADYGLHWVGDLMLDAYVDVQSDTGAVLLDVVEAGRHFRCRIDVATGQATLGVPGVIDQLATGPTPVRGGDAYQLSLANFDNKLYLWVDGDEIEFDQPTEYSALDVFGTEGPVRPYSTPDDAGDLAPVGLGSDGAALAVNRLRVLRDIYYIAVKSSDNVGQITDYNTGGPRSVDELWLLLSDPDRWFAFSERRSVEFSLQEDQFFALGDNSPQSQDSRLWTKPNNMPPPYVPRELLIGKAVFVYWPHSWNRVPGTSVPFPLFPNFSDMRIVR
jgi:signal peptidase I